MNIQTTPERDSDYELADLIEDALRWHAARIDADGMTVSAVARKMHITFEAAWPGAYERAREIQAASR